MARNRRRHRAFRVAPPAPVIQNPWGVQVSFGPAKARGAQIRPTPKPQVAAARSMGSGLEFYIQKNRRFFAPKGVLFGAIWQATTRHRVPSACVTGCGPRDGSCLVVQN